jgi:hypothetical protein
MDFSKREFNRSSADERNPDRKLNAERSKRFREGPPRSLGPSQALREGVRSPRSVLQGLGRDVPSTASVTRSLPSEQVSLKPTLFACSAMLAIAVGVFIGIRIAGVDIEQVAFPDLSVTRRLVQLIGASDGTLKHGEAAAILNDPTAQAQLSQPFSQAQATEPASLTDDPPSSEIVPLSAEPLRSTDLTQPATAAPDGGQNSSGGKDENVSPPSYQGAPVVVSSLLSLSPISLAEEKNSELYRQYLSWRDKDKRPQVERRPARSLRRVASAYASQAHRANLNNVSGNRLDSSKANENLARTNPKDQKDLRNSVRSEEAKQIQ